MWRVFKKLDGEVVGVDSLVLKARGISCFGWEVRQRLMVYRDICSREMGRQCC